MLDWPSIQETLFSLVRGDIREFAAKHREETFYGLFIDCDSHYGDVFVNLNTPESLRERAKAYKNDIQGIAGVAVPADLYAHKTIAEIEDQLRWSAGDWGYLQINRWDDWRHQWDPYRKAIDAFAHKGRSFEEAFMETACLVLLQIESCGVLDLLKRSEPFGTICADHDETTDETQERMRRVRAKAGGS